MSCWLTVSILSYGYPAIRYEEEAKRKRELEEEKKRKEKEKKKRKKEKMEREKAKLSFAVEDAVRPMLFCSCCIVACCLWLARIA